VYIVIAILAFGILIAVHELGHFTASKWMNVRVNEFSIGMGPILLKKQRGETLYTLRALPIGGACVIDGEDGDMGDERSLLAKKLWQRLIILVAGSFMNFVAGFLILLILFSTYCFGNNSTSTTTLSGFMDGFPLAGEQGLMAGDRLVSVDGHKANTVGEFATYMALGNGETVDLVIKRNGELIKLDNFPLKLREYTDETGAKVTKYGLYFETVKFTPLVALQQSWYRTSYSVRIVWISLGSLFNGKAGIGDLSGPVGVVSMMNQAGKQSANVGEGIINVLFMVSFIAINLAVMNLLPLPALDGGRIFFMYIFFVIEKLFRRKPSPKIEGYIHAAGFILLLGLMAYVMFNDIVKLI
jgi:regulator of sigma E protease